MSPVKNGDFIRAHPLTDKLIDSLGQKLRLHGRVIEGNERRSHYPPFPCGPQLLFILGSIWPDRGIGELEDFWNGPVISLYFKYLRIRVLILEAKYIIHIGTPPGIDGLGVITDHHKVLVFPHEQINQVTLHLVGILIFVHKNVSKFPLIKPAQLLMIL